MQNVTAPVLTPEDRVFVQEVRKVVLTIEEGGDLRSERNKTILPEEVGLGPAKLGSMRMVELLSARGLGPGCHVGRKDLDGTIASVEWYAGQLPDIVDNEAWFAVNSYINCIDKFAPESWT